MRIRGPYLPVRWAITSADRSGDPDVFPRLPGQKFLTTKSPVWKSDVQEASSGRERRRSKTRYARWHFKVSFDMLRLPTTTYDEFFDLLGFFCLRQGRVGTFYYLDPYDCTVVNQPFGTGDGATTVFQLSRVFNGYSDPVLAIAGAPTVMVNGIMSASYTLGSFGVVTFNSPPPAGADLRWSGVFMFLCRFDLDEIDLQQIFYDIFEGQDLEFRSVKAPEAV